MYLLFGHLVSFSVFQFSIYSVLQIWSNGLAREWCHFLVSSKFERFGKLFGLLAGILLKDLYYFQNFSTRNNLYDWKRCKVDSLLGFIFDLFLPGE